MAVPDLSSIYQNPAGLSFLNYNAIAVSYFKTLPIEGLGNIGLLGNFQTKILNLGFSVDNFGDQYYHESRFGLAAAKKMDKVSMGMKFSLLNNGIKDMSSRQTVLGEFGIIASPTKFFNVGLHLVNFTRAKLYESQTLPTILSFGVGLNPTKRVNISGQCDYYLNEKTIFRMGMFYQVRDQLSISTGVNPELKSVHFGLGLDIKKYKFQYAVSTHPSVGLSNHLTLALILNEKK